MFLLLEAVGAQIVVVDVNGTGTSVSPQQYLSIDMSRKIMQEIILPPLSPDLFTFRSYKVMSNNFLDDIIAQESVVHL